MRVDARVQVRGEEEVGRAERERASEGSGGRGLYKNGKNEKGNRRKGEIKLKNDTVNVFPHPPFSSTGALFPAILFAASPTGM